MLLKFNTLRLHYKHIAIELNVSLFKAALNTRSTLCVIWGNNLEGIGKLLSMIQSRCSIYSHFLKPLH